MFGRLRNYKEVMIFHMDSVGVLWTDAVVLQGFSSLPNCTPITHVIVSIPNRTASRLNLQSLLFKCRWQSKCIGFFGSRTWFTTYKLRKWPPSSR